MLLLGRDGFLNQAGGSHALVFSDTDIDYAGEHEGFRGSALQYCVNCLSFGEAVIVDPLLDKIAESEIGEGIAFAGRQL